MAKCDPMHLECKQSLPNIHNDAKGREGNEAPSSEAQRLGWISWSLLG